MSYVAEYQRPYENGYVNRPDESTPEMAEFMNARDDAILKIEQFLANLDLSGDYALLSEAGYSLELGIDNNYVMTISLKNKAGDILSSKQIDFPIESMVVNATYEDGKIILTLQNGNTLPIDISDMVRGLVPTTRKIAEIDLTDDITKEELQNALEIYDSTVMGGELKPYIHSFNEELVGIWIDGKPLYQIVLTGRTPIVEEDGTNMKATIDITHLDTDIAFVKNSYLHHITITTNGLNYLTLPVLTSLGYTTKAYVDYVDSTKQIVIHSNNSLYSDELCYVILQYTKTTDAEGSGNNLNPYGIYNAKLDEIEKYIEELQMPDITSTTETTMPNSYEGRLLFEEIGGVSEQETTTGAQLFDISTATTGYIGGTGNIVASNINALSGYIEVNGNGLTISFKNSMYNVGIATYDVNKTFISRKDLGAKKEYVVAANSNVYYVRVWMSIDNSYIGDRLPAYEPMINLGSTALPWEPYTGGIPSPNPEYPQEIKKTVVSEIKTHGKNWFDNSTFEGNKWFLNGDGSVADYEGRKASMLYIPVVGGKTYYTNCFDLSNNTEVPNQYAMTVVEYNANKNVLKTNEGINLGKTLIMQQDTAFVRIATINLNYYVVFSDLEIPTEYEPYTESVITLSQPIDLYGKGDAQDVIEGNRVIRKFIKFQLTSSMQWYYSDLTGRFWTNVAGIKTYSNTVQPNALCTHYRTTMQYDSTDMVLAPVNESTMGVAIRHSAFNGDISAFKSFLDENEVWCIWELATPTEEELPIADQIALNSLSTYDGITYLEFDSEIEPTFKGEYGTSKVGGYTLEGMLAGRNGELYGKDYNSRLSALEATVVNNI